MGVSKTVRRLAWTIGMPSTMPDGREVTPDELVVALVRELAAEPIARDAMREALGWRDEPIAVLIEGVVPEVER